MSKIQGKRATASRNGAHPAKEAPELLKIAVAGFKSIAEEQEIEVRPLTLLAGVNSAGKSSMMQPLLLMKQTLEETYDPGALLLNGPNVKFTAADQLLSRRTEESDNSFSVSLCYNAGGLEIQFQKQPGKGFEIPQMIAKSFHGDVKLARNMTSKKIGEILKQGASNFSFVISPQLLNRPWTLVRNRSFLSLYNTDQPGDETLGSGLLHFAAPYLATVKKDLLNIIHLPGFRGSPARSYPMTAVGATFPGTFDSYTASLVAEWADNNRTKLNALWNDLRHLHLTSSVTARRLNDAQVEIQVARLMDYSANRKRSDMVNIADVGFGVSQTLPVVVALHVAQPGQIVYIEQPELHLHPSAQVAMAEVLAGAARRGVRVVAETHSSLILMGVQTLVAEGKLDPKLVSLNWFERINGATKVTAADLDEAGRFGDWPVDFDDVALQAESRYLNAAEARLAKPKKK